MSEETKCPWCGKESRFLLPGRHCYDCIIYEPLIDDPESKYMILACNINSEDRWIWKYLRKEHNFIPVFDETQGNCFYRRDEIEEVLKLANSWVEFGKEQGRKTTIWILRTTENK